MAEERPPQPMELFEDRLRREGLYTQYRTRIRELMSEDIHFHKSRRTAAKEFGYLGPKTEREKHEEWKAAGAPGFVQLQHQQARKEFNEQQRIEDFEEAMMQLPNVAAPQAELEWVGSHPAMYRKARMRKQGPVTIDANDILYSPNGRAPSRRAVNRLFHFANKPEKFFDPIMSEEKKKSPTAADEVESNEQDMGLGDVKKYLEELRGA